MNETEATSRTTSAGEVLRVRHREVEEDERAGAEQEQRPQEPVQDREHALSGEVHRTRERRHEGVLDRPLPALPGDGLHEELEEDPEVGPDDGPDEQGRHRRVDVELAARRLDPLRDEDDRQRVGHGPHEPGDVPPDVALGEVGVALDDAAGADELRAHRSEHGPHAITSRSSSSSSSSSASNARPVAAKKACSSVSAP